MKHKTILFIFLFLSIGNGIAGVEPINEVFEPTGDFDPNKFGKVAVIQWARNEDTPLDVTEEQAEAFKTESRKLLASRIEEAVKKGAQMVITPEFATVGYPDIPELPPEDDQFQTPEQIKPYAETIPGNTTRFFSAVAKKNKIYLHIGLAESDAEKKTFYNTVVAFDPTGSIVAQFRKMNLYGPENKFLSPGKSPVSYLSPFGTVGLIICSDVYSSNPMEYYKKAKVNVLALSTSWDAYNSGMNAFIAGAKRVGAYLLAANQPYFPDSGVIEPSGATQSHIRQTAGIAYGFLPFREKR